MAIEYDLVVLGGGIGGYVAAIRASQYGLHTAIVEADKLGGTCLHKGCIPSKALLRSAEVYTTLKQGEMYGITSSEIGFDIRKAQTRKNTIVGKLHKGLQQLMKQHQIDIYTGYGRILGPSIFSPSAGTISVESTDQKETEMLVPQHVLIATGSKPRTLPGLEIDGQYVLSSNEALELDHLPGSVVIVGGGVIGVEWASLLSDLDVNVTLVEYADRILPLEDESISKEMARLLRQRNVNIHTSTEILADTLSKAEGHVTIQAMEGEERHTFQAEKMLVSVGRVPAIDNIGLQNTNIRIHDHHIEVNKYYQTNESHIYAVGDVTGGHQLAHVAAHEGIIAAQHMAGREPEPMGYDHVPRCTYSHPEIASVGMTEEEARQKGYKVKTGRFSFTAIGKALVYGEHDGFVKMIMDEESQDLLGVHMIGPHVTDMISEAGLAMLLDATPWEISQSIHPHPSLSEALGEASMAIEGLQIHS